ncbi:MAG: long-chain-fatty-acid--CoA ligase [Deltaproteobacteria bacterium]|nr:long-chain-fatty-acid--CoA ligase [Deltaproteobacteria bacterium]
MRNNLGLFLTKRCQLGPRREALVEVERGRRFSYAELEARSNRTANALRGLGVGPGDRVAILMMNSAEFVESYFAIAKLGAIMVPLNWRLTPDELEFILGDAGALLLLFGSEFDDCAAELQRRALPVKLWVRAKSREAGPGPGPSQDYDELTAAASDSLPEIGAEGDDDLFIMYTSGTTGLPKGVVHSHDTVIAASTTILMTADMRHNDRYLALLPLFHVGALTPLINCVHRGCATVILRAFDPSLIFPTIERERITTGLAVPAMLRFMLAAGNHEAHDHSMLRWLMSGAAPVPVPLIEQFAALGIEIHQVYGLTESCGPACLISPEEAIAKAGSTGPAFFHTEVRVVNDAGADVAEGEIGEVIVRAPHVMKGYWNRPDDTAETIRNGWLHTGDMASLDAEGFVYIQDRKKDMIISGGENVYPAEIENLLSGHPDVADVAAIGLPSEKWGESPAVIVVPRPGAKLDGDALLDYCQGKLARFKQPKQVEFVEEIPRNPTGKILKRLLRERFPGPAPE